LKKIIYTDLDGTLFDYNDEGAFVSNENIKAINEWTKKNYLGIATGRNVLSVKRIFNKIPLNINLPFVLTNGACVYDLKEDKIVYENPIKKAVIDEAVEYINKKPIAMMLLIGAKSRYYVGDFSKSGFKKPTYELTEISKEEINYDEILKVDFIVKEENNPELVKDINNFKSKDLFQIVPSSIRYVEIVDKNSSKYNGIIKALEYMNISNYELHTVGDYLNDYDMLKYADVSYAPKNANEKIKQIADHIVKSNKEHAIKDVIKRVNKL